MPTRVIMPKLGESVVEGTVTGWLKKEGEPVDEFESLLEVNTDKVDTEIPSPASGTILKIIVPEGTTVTAGTVLAWIGQPGEEIPAGEEQGPEGAASAATVSAAVEEVPTPQAAEKQPARDIGFISPVVARMAKEKNVDLNQVKGTGQGGRITKKDVLAYLEAAPQPARPEAAAWETPGEGDLFRPTEMMFPSAHPAQAEAPEPSAAAPVPEGDRLIPHTVMRKRIADHMVLSKHTSPHVTTVMEANFTRVIANYEKNKSAFARGGANLTYTAYFAAACAAALRAFPIVNSSWSDEGVIIHAHVNLGIAVSLGEEGLIVPVIHDADNLSLLGMARAINDLAARARAHQLKPDEVQGGTFSITNHGISGSLFATPVINQPQCAILGVGVVKKRAVVVAGDAIAVRPMVYLSLTFDHRILDGASGDGFLARVVENLENWPD